MPGQRERKRQQRDERERAAARCAPDTGHWEVLFETDDAVEWRAHMRRLRSSDTRIDWTAVRMDMFCGRLVHPTAYRLSVFVPDPDRDPRQEPADS
ncbi:hypothetical protein ACFYXS_16285 [Streptomyces sp. NPDC002574]|uniref:hypothetical protein n=1 Tax=Streptomyces sp. NPDC002574 TaxID=3364652 RepID=UPI0036BD4057